MERLAIVLSDLSHLNLEDQIVDKQAYASGLGGSSDVFTAWSTKHQKKVAVKQVRVFMKKDQAFMKRLAREIRIWAKLEHECILPFLGFFTEGENMLPNLVSEWMQNGTLIDYLKDSGVTLGAADLWSMARAIASGIEYLHANGVIHADLKGTNILISPNHSPLLVDFGLSLALYQSVTTSTTYSMERGSVRWMAIELLAPEPATHSEATDVLAFGMVIYEMLSGNLPYNQYKSDLQVIPAISRGELPSRPASVVPKDGLFDDALWDLCCSCWTADPFARPDASQLSSVLSEEPSSDTPFTYLKEKREYDLDRRNLRYQRKGRLFALLLERFPYNKEKSWFRVEITLSALNVHVQHQYTSGACETVGQEIDFSGKDAKFEVTPFERTRITPYPHGWSYPFAVMQRRESENTNQLVLAATSQAERATWLTAFRNISGIIVTDLENLPDEILRSSQALP